MLLGELSLRPQVQAKIREEIALIAEENGSENWREYRPVYEDLNKMKYIDNTVKETQRLWPILPHLVRMTNEDETYQNMNIPKGVRRNFIEFSVTESSKMCSWMCFRTIETQNTLLTH